MNKAFAPIIMRKKRPLIPLGTAVHWGCMGNDGYRALLEKYYKGDIRPEVEGCWFWIYGYYQDHGPHGFEYMDKLVEWAKSNQRNVHYHCLRWWFPDQIQQPPDVYQWLEEVFLRYWFIRDWTVVNEGWWMGVPTLPDIEDCYNYANFMKQRIYNAYKSKIRLFYSGILRDQTEQENVKDLISRGLVEGVCLQCHHWLGIDLSIYHPFLLWLRSQKIPWCVSEMDVEIPDNDVRYLTLQAIAYKDMYEIALAYGAERFSTWGVADPWSWLKDHPLLFDYDLQPKPAYFVLR